jgi:hypothetical protein
MQTREHSELFTALMSVQAHIEISSGVFTSNPLFLFAECWLFFQSVTSVPRKLQRLSPIVMDGPTSELKYDCMTYVAFFGVDCLFAKLLKIFNTPKWLAAVMEKFGAERVMQILKEMKQMGRHSLSKLCSWHATRNVWVFDTRNDSYPDTFYLAQVQVILRALLIKFRRLTSSEPCRDNYSLMKLSMYTNYIAPFTLWPFPLENASLATLQKNVLGRLSNNSVPEVQCLLRRTESFHNYSFAQSLCDDLSFPTDFRQLGVLITCACRFDEAASCRWLFGAARDVSALIFSHVRLLCGVLGLAPHPARVQALRLAIKHKSYPDVEFCFEPFQTANTIQAYQCQVCSHEISRKKTYRQIASDRAVCLDCLTRIHWEVADGVMV